MTITDTLLNERPLTLDDSRTEIVRVYEVTLHKPGLADDDGHEITYPVQVSLRYDHRKAAGRAPASDLALAEAARRAIKLERAGFHMPNNRVLEVDPASDVTFIREMERPARAA